MYSWPFNKLFLKLPFLHIKEHLKKYLGHQLKRDGQFDFIFLLLLLLVENCSCHMINDVWKFLFYFTDFFPSVLLLCVLLLLLSISLLTFLFTVLVAKLLNDLPWFCRQLWTCFPYSESKTPDMPAIMLRRWRPTSFPVFSFSFPVSCNFIPCKKLM